MSPSLWSAEIRTPENHEIVFNLVKTEAGLQLSGYFDSRLIKPDALNRYRDRERELNGSYPQVYLAQNACQTSLLNHSTKNHYVLQPLSNFYNLYYVNKDLNKTELIRITDRHPLFLLAASIKQRKEPTLVLNLLNRLIGDRNQYRDNVTLLLSPGTPRSTFEIVNYSQSFDKMNAAFTILSDLLSLPECYKTTFNQILEYQRAELVQAESPKPRPKL